MVCVVDLFRKKKRWMRSDGRKQQKSETIIAGVVMGLKLGRKFYDT